MLIVPISIYSQSNGIISDDLILPPYYDTFNPPSNAGGSYIDPAFGTKITRMTNSSIIPIQYEPLGGYTSNSEICYYNIDGSYFIALETALDNGKRINYTYLFNGVTGAKLQNLGTGDIRPYNLRWALANKYKKNGQHVTIDPVYHFYIYTGNEIRLYDVRNMEDHVVIRKFSEYGSIGAAGNEGDISDDGRYWVLDGNAKELFAYDLIDDIKHPVSGFDLGSLGSKGSAVGVDYSAISPRGNYILVSWGTDPGVGRYRGIEVYDKNWNFQRQIYPGIIHWEVGVDVYGHEVVYTVGPVKTPEFTALDGINLGDIISIKIDDGKVRLLKRIPKWAHFCPTACNSVNDPRYIYFSILGTRSEDPNQLWFPFWGEIIEIPTDGSGEIRRLAHHRSRKHFGQSEKFSQPDLVVNRQGTKIVYRSTYGTQYADLYHFNVLPREGGGGVVDVIPPLAPIGLDAIPGSHNIELTWEAPGAAEDGDIPLYYEIYRDNIKIAEMYGLAYTDNGLAESNSYEYKVYAVDDAHNRSLEAVVGTFSTIGDSDPPQLLGLSVLNREELSLKFSKALDQASAETAENYQLTLNGQIYSATLVDDVTVKLSTSFLELGKEYELTVQNITDATTNKNPIETVTRNFRLLKDFFEDFEAFNFSDWDFVTPSRWEIKTVEGNKLLELNTSDYDSPGGKRLGEYTLIPAEKFIAQNFNLSCHVQSTEDILANPYADFAIIFNYIDDMNYYYLQFQERGVALSRIANGERIDSEVDWKGSFEPDELNMVYITLDGDLLTISANGSEITKCNVSITQAGQIGFGSFNDAVQFDNINIGGNLRGDTSAPQPPVGLKVSWK